MQKTVNYIKLRISDFIEQNKFFINKYFRFDATLRNFALDDSVSDVLDGEKAVAFVLHGYRDSIGGWVTELTKKWSDADEINVCAVDWSVWANCNYVLQRLRYVDKVANYIKKRIDFLKEKLAYENENIIIVGHSLGAQIMGKAAKKMSPGKPKFCYGKISLLLFLAISYQWFKLI